MSIIPINVFGDSILRKKAKKLTDIDSSVIKLIKSMFESMKNASGVGLAANQVGVDKSLFIVDLSEVEGYEKQKPLVMINPVIKIRSDENILIEEGCLSLPYLRAEVERPKIIQVNYYDTDMKEHSLEADQFLARVIQHEYDHLQGVLFVDRLPESERKKLKAELNKIKKRRIEAEYPISDIKGITVTA